MKQRNKRVRLKPAPQQQAGQRGDTLEDPQANQYGGVMVSPDAVTSAFSFVSGGKAFASQDDIIKILLAAGWQGSSAAQMAKEMCAQPKPPPLPPHLAISVTPVNEPPLTVPMPLNTPACPGPPPPTPFVPAQTSTSQPVTAHAPDNAASSVQLVEALLGLLAQNRIRDWDPAKESTFAKPFF